jgi:hypothetical protein
MARRFLHSTLFPAVITLAACASMNGIAPQTSPRDANTLAAQRSLQDTRVDTATWPGQVWWKSLGTRNSLQATLSWDLDFRGTYRAAYEAALGTAGGGSRRAGGAARAVGRRRRGQSRPPRPARMPGRWPSALGGGYEPSPALATGT